jgi:glycosyl transferase family 25
VAPHDPTSARERIRRLMRLYVINLPRRTDRLAHMTREIGRFGLAFERIEAVDAAVLAAEGRTNPHLPGGAFGCTLSHLEVYRRFLATGEAYATVLEDDVLFSDDARPFLADADWVPAGTDLVKLETFATRVFLRGSATAAPAGHRLHELHFRHNGSAAYVVSRRFAERFAAIDPASLTHAMDEVLFDPRLRVVAGARVLQLVPAVAIQEMKCGGGRLSTDIAPQRDRSAARPDDPRYRGPLGRLRWATRDLRHAVAARLRRLRQALRSRTTDLVDVETPFGDRSDRID